MDSKVESIIICSPVSGMCDDITKCPDEVFSQKMAGDGVFVMPDDPVIAAPADGTVSMLFETRHALIFSTDSGADILIHLGIDTVALKGEGFEALVSEGDHVAKGTPLIRADLDHIRAHAPSVATPVLVPELAEGQSIRRLAAGYVAKGDPLFAIETMA